MNRVSVAMSESLKARVRDFWEANPCGGKFAGLADEQIGTREFFDAVERHRYETEWHIPEVVRFDQWRDREVLEVGCGLATDGVRFARAGARYTGIDLTAKAIGLARRRFDLEDLRADLRVADAEALPLPDSRFDLVYSHGVLHHTPNTQMAIDEIHRVLRPGGTAMVMLYHRHSYNYYVNIMMLRRLGVRLLGFAWGPSLVHRLTGEDEKRLGEMRKMYLSNSELLLDRAEFLSRNTDGAGNPLARAYTRREAGRMFAAFDDVHTEVHFLNKRWVPVVGKLMPRAVERRLGRVVGWHLWITARKGRRKANVKAVQLHEE